MWKISLYIYKKKCVWSWKEKQKKQLAKFAKTFGLKKTKI